MVIRGYKACPEEKRCLNLRLHCCEAAVYACRKGVVLFLTGKHDVTSCQESLRN